MTEDMDEEPQEEIKEVPKEEKKEEKPKNTEGWKLLSLFIIAILIIGGMIYYTDTEPATLDERFEEVMSGSEEYGYLHNGFAFVRDPSEGYITRLAVQDTVIAIPLHFGPREIQNISAGGNLNGTLFQTGTIYLTFDPNSTQMQYVALSAAELSLNLAKGIGVRPIAACTHNSTECEGRPILTCDNTELPVIYLRINEDLPEGGIFFEDNCIILEGNEWGIVKAVDAFLLKWYRIL